MSLRDDLNQFRKEESASQAAFVQWCERVKETLDNSVPRRVRSFI